MNTVKKNHLLGLSSLLGATFAYGWFGVLSRSIGSTLPLFYQISFRSLITFVLFLLFLTLTRKFKKMTALQWRWTALRSVFDLGATTMAFIAFNHLPLGTVYFIFYSGSTIGGYLLGKFLFHEELSKLKWLALLLCMFGLAFIYSVTLQGNPFYYLLSLASGICVSFWNVLSKKLPSSLEPAQVSMADNILAASFGFLVSLLLRETWIIPSLSIPWRAVYVSGVLQVVTGLLVVIGFRKVEAQVGSLVMLTEILFGIIFGFVLYREVINLTTLIGGGFILGGIILPELHFSTKKK